MVFQSSIRTSGSETPRTSSLSGSMHGGALDASVILEIGCAFIRVGLAGEATPRHILPSPLKDWLPTALPPAGVDNYFFPPSGSEEGHEQKETDSSKLANPGVNQRIAFPQNSTAQWIKRLTPLLSDIIHNKLLVKPKSRRILILEHMVTPTNFRNAVTQVLFEKFGFPSLLFVTGPNSAALYGTGKSYGLVVDVGCAEARCAISFGGQYVPRTFHAVPCGYENIVQLFQSYTSIPQLKEGSKESLLDAHALVAHTTGEGGGIQSNRPSDCGAVAKDVTSAVVECTLPSSGEQVQIDTDTIQTAWSESLDVTSDTSIPHMILSSLLECPMDLRKIIVQNVLLVGGGGCLMPGFQERLLSELHYGVCNMDKFKRLRPCVKDPAGGLTFAKVPFSPDLRCWIGGSILGTLGLSDEKWIFRQAWLERIEQFGHEDDSGKTGYGSSRGATGLIYDWLHV